MKKLLHSTRKEKGFILPSVLFLTTIVLLYFSSSVITYSHDIKITYTMMEQVKSQSLFQMAYVQYKKDYLSQNIIEEHVKYSFPMGSAKVKTSVVDETIHFEFTIQTNNDFSSTVTKSSKIPSDEETAL